MQGFVHAKQVFYHWVIYPAFRIVIFIRQTLNSHASVFSKSHQSAYFHEYCCILLQHLQVNGRLEFSSSRLQVCCTAHGTATKMTSVLDHFTEIVFISKASFFFCTSYIIRVYILVVVDISFTRLLVTATSMKQASFPESWQQKPMAVFSCLTFVMCFHL